MESKSKRNTRRLFMLSLVLPLLALACSAIIPNVGVDQREVQGPAVVTMVVEATPMAVAPAEQVQPVAPIEAPAELLDQEELYVNLYTRANHSVVNITTYISQNDLLIPQGQGSGFVYDQEGHIVTNAHVVHGSDEVEVTFSDGTVFVGEVIGQDLNSDLAVVEIAELPAGVSPLPLGAMESLQVGQTVVAIGNPFGLEGTLTRGIISALGRNIPALTPFSIPQSIQTDAAINPGNSGGPLLNLNGEVIGVNAQIETDGTSQSNLGVGFAIPVSIVKNVVPDLITDGEHKWAWLGVRGGGLSPALIEAMDLPFNKGAYIAEVVNRGPSDKAGLRGAGEMEIIEGRQLELGGDVITAVDGIPVNSFDDLLIYIALETSPDQEVEVTVWRDGEYRDITVTMEARPSSLN